MTQTTRELVRINLSSKDNEIQTLNAIANSINATDPNSYLASLFTPEFISWVSQMIHSDIMPDMESALKANENSAHKNSVEHSQAEITITKQSELIDSQAERIETLTERIDLKTSEIDYLKREQRDLEIAGKKQELKEAFHLTEKDLEVVWFMIKRYSILYHTDYLWRGWSQYTIRKLEKNGLIDNEPENGIYSLSMRVEHWITQNMTSELLYSVQMFG
jgi:hypothetical protein